MPQVKRFAALLTQHKGEINFVVPLVFFLREQGFTVDLFYCPDLEDYGGARFISQAVNDDYLGIKTRLGTRSLSLQESVNHLSRYQKVFIDHGAHAASGLISALGLSRVAFIDHCIYIYLFLRPMLSLPNHIHANARHDANLFGYHPASAKRVAWWGWRNYIPLGNFFSTQSFFSYLDTLLGPQISIPSSSLIVYTREFRGDGYSPSFVQWVSYHDSLAVMAKQLGYSFILRTHPSQDKKQVEFLHERYANYPGLSFQQGDSIDLFSLAHIDGLHIGLSTSACILPAAYGMRTSLLWLPHSPGYKEPNNTYHPNIPFADFSSLGLPSYCLQAPSDISLDLLNKVPCFISDQTLHPNALKSLLGAS